MDGGRKEEVVVETVKEEVGVVKVENEELKRGRWHVGGGGGLYQSWVMEEVLEAEVVMITVEIAAVLYLSSAIHCHHSRSLVAFTQKAFTGTL